MTWFNGCEPKCFQLLKFSITTDPVRSKTLSWNHLENDISLIVNDFRPSSNAAQSVECPRTYAILEGTRILEQFNVDEVMAKNSPVIRVKGYKNQLKAEQLPTFALYRTADWAVAICYPPTANEIRRIQLKFSSEDDYMSVFGYLQALKFPMKTCEVQPKASRSASNANRGPQASGPGPGPGSGPDPLPVTEASHHRPEPSSYGNTDAESTVVRNCGVEQPSRDQMRPPISRHTIAQQHEKTRQASDFHNVQDMQDLLATSRYTDTLVPSYMPRHLEITRPTIAELSAAQTQNKIQPPHLHPSANSQTEQNQYKGPVVSRNEWQMLGARPVTSHSDSISFAASSNQYEQRSEVDLAHVALSSTERHEETSQPHDRGMDTFTGLIPPRRELPFAKPSSNGSGRSSSTALPKRPSSSFEPRSDPFMTSNVLHNSYNVSSKSIMTGTNHLSDTARQNAAQRSSSVVDFGSSSASTIPAKGYFSALSNQQRSSPPRPVLSSSTLSGITLPLLKPQQVKSSSNDQHIGLSQLTGLAGYSAIPREERMANIESMLANAISDDNFIAFCEDVNECWRARIGLGF